MRDDPESLLFVCAQPIYGSNQSHQLATRDHPVASWRIRFRYLGCVFQRRLGISNPSRSRNDSHRFHDGFDPNYSEIYHAIDRPGIGRSNSRVPVKHQHPRHNMTNQRAPHQREPSAHEVFEVLARDHADHLLVFLRAVVRDRSMVDDVFQETMMVAWRRLADFDRTRSFGAWLRGIGSRVAMDFAGRRRMIVADPTMLQEIEEHSVAFDGDHAQAFQTRMGTLDDCIERLPTDYSQMVQMVYRAELPLRTIAVNLALTEEAVKKRIQRARALLGECLQRKGVLA